MGSDRRETGTGKREAASDRAPATPAWRPARREPRRAGLPVETRVPLIVLAGGVPGVVVSLVWLWAGEHGVEVRWTLTVLVLGAWVSAAALARERVVRPLQTLSNLLSGLREGDYSVRGAGANEHDAL